MSDALKLGLVKRNYTFDMTIPERALARSKRPPLCDSDSRPFIPDEYGMYHVTALVLNSGIWGLVCNECKKKHFSKMTHFTENEAPIKAKEALFGTLSSEPRFSVF